MDVRFNIVIVGATDVGKTEFLTQYVDSHCPDKYSGTAQTGGFGVKKIQWSDGSTVTIYLWDTPGWLWDSKSRDFYIRSYKKKAHAFIVMFDFTHKNTLEACVKWIHYLDQEYKRTDSSIIPCLLLGNKSDLIDKRDISNEEIEEICTENSFWGWHEISAKDGTKVEESLGSFIEELMVNHKPNDTDYILSASSKVKTYKSKKATGIKTDTEGGTWTEFKIIILGPSYVGKSAFLDRYVYDRFAEPTNCGGVGFAVKQIDWTDRRRIKINLFDLWGIEKGKSLNKIHYKQSDACIIMLDITDQKSLEGCLWWTKHLEKHCRKSDRPVPPCLLVTNKCDLEERREISHEEIAELCESHNFLAWRECSAKDGTSVEETMKFLIGHLMKKHADDQYEKSTSSRCAIS